MNWPEAFTAVGIAAAVAAIFWALAWSSRGSAGEPDEREPIPAVRWETTTTYGPGQQKAHGAVPAKVTPAGTVPTPTGPPREAPADMFRERAGND